jgi:xylulokinase
MKSIIGIDIGTSSLKVLAVNESGEVIAQALSAYEIERPQPNFAEQQPHIWWRALCDAIGELRTKIKAEDISAIGLTGQMHGATVLDKHHKPIRPAIIWADARSAKQIDELHRRISSSEIIRITGNRPAVGFMAMSLMWLRKNEPRSFEQIAQVMLPKDYIGFCLTSEHVSEPSDASATLLLDLKERHWSQTMIEACEVERAWLPRLAKSNEVIGAVTKTAAAQTGLREGTFVVAGGGDTPCAAFALGVTQPNQVVCTVGTAAQLFLPTDAPMIDLGGRIHALCHCAPKMWYVMGAHLNGGLCLSWLAALFPETSIKKLMREASQVSIGSDGLFFLPYLQGERTPHFDPNARGVFFGLNATHTRGHLVRAVLEGVAFALRDSLEIFRSMSQVNTKLLLVGGAMQNALWQEIVASVLALPTSATDNPHGSALGAAMLAGESVGMNNMIEMRMMNAMHEIPTIANTIDRYAERYMRYAELYPTMKSLWR